MVFLLILNLIMMTMLIMTKLKVWCSGRQVLSRARLLVGPTCVNSFGENRFYQIFIPHYQNNHEHPYDYHSKVCTKMGDIFYAFLIMTIIQCMERRRKLESVQSHSHDHLCPKIMMTIIMKTTMILSKWSPVHGAREKKGVRTTSAAAPTLCHLEHTQVDLITILWYQ